MTFSDLNYITYTKIFQNRVSQLDFLEDLHTRTLVVVTPILISTGIF